MKTILLATAAITLAGTAAWAIDDDNRHTRLRVTGDRAADAPGTMIEIRGEDGERTIHIQGDAPATRLTVNGQTVEIDGNSVMIDGQRVETEGAGVIIVEGDEIQVLRDGDFNRFDGRFTRHMAERAEHTARMAEGMHDFHFEFDSEGMRTEVLDSLTAALAGLDSETFRDGNSSDWDDMSEAERQEVRAALEDARAEIREAMREVQVELREARDEGRRVRVEMMHEARRDEARAERDEVRSHRDQARAERDAERAVRDEIRAARDEARELAREARNEARIARHNVMRWETTGDGDGYQEQSVRIERNDDGRRQVWVNGEEQTGDSLVDWLNRIEAERLAGGPADRHRERRIVRFDRDDGSSDEVDLTGRQVIVLRSDDDDGARRVFEFEFETDELDDEK
ncbi:hypothetical protein [Maricaulis sp.]|uniref:hypothetical protein n=1 Tax=Maricaulis sp. TaxID=1486257 RepID=UPI003A916BF3